MRRIPWTQTQKAWNAVSRTYWVIMVGVQKIGIPPNSEGQAHGFQMGARTPLIPAWEASCTISWQGIHLHFFPCHETWLSPSWQINLLQEVSRHCGSQAMAWVLETARFTVTKIRPRRLENHALQGYGGFYLDFKGRPGRLGQDLLGQPTREQGVTL